MVTYNFPVGNNNRTSIFPVANAVAGGHNPELVSARPDPRWSIPSLATVRVDGVAEMPQNRCCHFPPYLR